MTYAMKKTTQYQYQWKYSSVIIILMYVTSNSCPDTEFSVHQCAIFTHNHKQSHDKEVLSIFKHLQCNIKYGKKKGVGNLPFKQDYGWLLHICRLFRVVRIRRLTWPSLFQINNLLCNNFSDFYIMLVSKLQGWSSLYNFHA